MENSGHGYSEGSEWHASPKPKKPLSERLDSLSEKIRKAKSEGIEPVKLTDEQLLEVKIWNVFRDNQYSSRIQDHIDPVKKIVYQYAAEQLKEERNKAIDLFREVLSTLQSKETEYKECSVEGNINREYFKGKADAYEFAAKQLERVFEWHGLKSDSK